MFRILALPRPAANPAAPLAADSPIHTKAHPEPPQDVQPAGVGTAPANRAESAQSAESVHDQPAPRVIDLLDAGLQELTKVVHSLPDTSCKDEILRGAALCATQIANAQCAAAHIEAWDLQQGKALRITHQELLRLRADIKQCAKSVHDALAGLNQLATGIRDYPDNEAPGTKAIVLLSIAGVASALAVLVVTAVFPPLGFALFGALAAGGMAGGGYLIHKVCQAASAHEGFEKANSNVSGYLRQSLDKAGALQRRFNDELIPALLDNAKARATGLLQDFLDQQMSLAPFEQNNDNLEPREAWRNDMYKQLAKDLPRDQSEPVYPCEIAGKSLLPHGSRIELEQAKKDVQKTIDAAARGDTDTADALLYLVAQRPRNAVENATKTAVSAAIGLPSAIPIAGGVAINLVQVFCDDNGKAVGGEITYKLFHPDRDHGAPLHIMPPGVGEPTLAPEDADLCGTAKFELEGRNIKVTSFEFRASVSLLATCAEIYATEIQEQALSGRVDQFVFPDGPLASSSGQGSADVPALAR